MENINVNEVVTNEEAATMAAEAAKAVTGNGLKIVGVAGGVLGLGYVGYKFIVKPVVAKIKAKKAAKAEAEVEAE